MSGESITNYDSGSETNVAIYKTKGLGDESWWPDNLIEYFNVRLSWNYMNWRQGV
jgi:hypothetical protein